MKKFVVSILLLSMLLVIFPFGISVSAEETFTAEEAMKLFEAAEMFYLILENGSERFSIYNKAFDFQEGKTNPSDAFSGRRNGILTWNMSDYKDNVDKTALLPLLQAENYFHYKVTAYTVEDFTFPINDIDDLKNLAGLYFADGKKFIDDFQAFFAENHYFDCVSSPLFVDENGDVYHLMLENFDLYHVERYSVLDYSDFIVNGNKASITLSLYRTVSWGYAELVRIPVEFVKTEAGWRISGDVFNTILHNVGRTGKLEGPYRKYLIGEWNDGEWAYINPNTSDSTVPAVAILGTVAVISLALPIVIYKKRRRVV